MNFWKNEEKSEKAGSEDGSQHESGSVFLTDKEFSRNSILVCATHGNIYAIHKSDGSRLWRAKFPAMGGVISLFVTDDDKLIAGANGKTACLNLLTGETIWMNRMPGFGFEEVSVLTTPTRFLQPHKLPEQLAHDSNEFPPNYNEQVIPDKPIVLGCTRGKALAMDIETGETLWKYNCPGGWYNIPVALVEPPSLEENRPNQLVYIGAGKWVYCLKARTGDVIWSVKVSDSTFGLNYMTLATPWSSRLAAEAHTAFSSNPVAQVRAEARQREHSSS